MSAEGACWDQNFDLYLFMAEYESRPPNTVYLYIFKMIEELLERGLNVLLMIKVKVESRLLLSFCVCACVTF